MSLLIFEICESGYSIDIEMTDHKTDQEDIMDDRKPVLEKEEIKEFGEKTKAYFDGEISKNEYKAYSGRYGSYAQRGGKSSMIRLRMAGGRLTKEKLRYLVDCIEKYKIQKVHLTTCQTIQLHDLGKEAVCGILESSIRNGIITLGGGGDYPRNVMAPPLSGTEEGEYFDVLPYAEEAEKYLLSFLDAEKMPRKLKVCFSGGPSNVTHATFRDLGFVAGPEGTFDVYSAGGLGPHPKIGMKMAEGIDPSRILYHICAMRRVFLEHGNYEQRSRARTRYMRDVLGDEGYRQAYLEKLEEAEKEEDLMIRPEIKRTEKKGDGTRVSGNRILSQKQEGLYTAAYHPIGGCPGPSAFGRIYDLIRGMDDVEIRIAPGGTMYLINLTGKEAEAVLQVTGDGAETAFESSVACIGAAVCQSGVRDSQELIHKAVEKVREAGISAGALPRVHISGCPSSCGAHQIGRIGFRGGVKVTEQGPVSAYEVSFFGCESQGKETLGTAAGSMPENVIPDFLAELGKEVDRSGVPYEQWERKNRGKLFEIAEKYM